MLLDLMSQVRYLDAIFCSLRKLLSWLVALLVGKLITEFVANNFFLWNHIDIGRFDHWTLSDMIKCLHDIPKEAASSRG